MIGHHFVETCWGDFAYVSGERGLLATFLPDTSSIKLEGLIQKRYPMAAYGVHRRPDFELDVEAYFDAEPVRFEVPLDLRGLSEFRRRVLKACARVRYGYTSSYLKLAGTAGHPGAARAVGTVMATNPLPLVIPCHRILRNDGSLGEFSSPGGCKTKKRLLELEAGP